MITLLLPPPRGATGELSEWLKEHDWKSCNGQKPFGGSNPPLSAKSARHWRAHLFGAESEGFEVTEMLAGRPRWRQSGGLPEAKRAVPAFRAAGGDARRVAPEGIPHSPPKAPAIGGRTCLVRRVRDSKSLKCWQVGPAGGSPADCRRRKGPCQHFVRPEGMPAGWPRRVSPTLRQTNARHWPQKWGLIGLAAATRSQNKAPRCEQNSKDMGSNHQPP